MPASTAEIEIIVNAACWDAEPAARDVVRRALEQAARRAPGAGTVTVVLTDDDEITALNRDWRGADKPTNVLSFPAAAAPDPGLAPAALGDIVIAFDTVRREADAEEKEFGHHLSHLAVHGYLHLLGHDHQTDIMAQTMEDLEREILLALGIADPYAETRAHDLSPGR